MPKLLAADGEQAELLKSYRLCRVDVSTEYGKKVAEAFGATQFPHTAIIDKTGASVLFKKSGQIAGDQWQSTLTKFEKGVQPQTVYFRGNTILGAQSSQRYLATARAASARRWASKAQTAEWR